MLTYQAEAEEGDVSGLAVPGLDDLGEGVGLGGLALELDGDDGEQEHLDWVRVTRVKSKEGRKRKCNGRRKRGEKACLRRTLGGDGEIPVAPAAYQYGPLTPYE